MSEAAELQAMVARLRRWMEEEGVGADVLASVAGLRPERLRKVLLGAPDVTVDEAERLARALGRTAAELLGAPEGRE